MTLWFKFPDEAAASLVFDDDAKRKFGEVFAADNPQSPWNAALDLLGFQKTSEALIQWHEGSPYFNWSAMVDVIGGGAIKVLRKNDNGYAFHVSYAPFGLWRMFVCQWKTVRFLQKPPSEKDGIAHSIALGLVLQIMILRLGKYADADLAKWLAGTASVPQTYQKTVAQLHAVQMRRTLLSPLWKEILPQKMVEQDKALPEYFWDRPPISAASVQKRIEQKNWTGHSVCAGKVSGRAVVIAKVSEAKLSKEKDMPIILIFRRARPETVELFEFADAVLFAEGGLLSHACVVAREMNIPAVTGLGSDFYDEAAKCGGMISVDAVSGTVEFLVSETK